MTEPHRFPEEEWGFVTDRFRTPKEASALGLNPFWALGIYRRDEEQRELWERLGADAVEAWVTEYPGTRPSLWWKFTAPDERFEGETQAAYLRRHGLLRPGEAERIPEGRG